MRTRQEIVQSLIEQSAADPILSSVSRSMVGKELLYFGANVIYQIEALGDSVSRFADLTRADFQQLIAYAYTNDLSCDTVKPAVVRIKLSGVSSRVFCPFEICLQVGNLTFYNIDFVRSDQEISLYQGTLNAVTSLSVGQEEARLNAFGLDDNMSIEYGSWQLYSEFKSGIYQSSYIKLGEAVVSDSVRVFARALDAGSQPNSQGVVFPYTEFNQSLAAPDAKLYKVRTGWARSVNVLFGDANWGMQINQEQFQYEIYWLAAGTTNYNLTSNNILVLGWGSSAQNLTQTGDSYYSVVSYTYGENDSLAYARSYLQTKKFLQQGLITVAQLQSYLDTLDAVNSYIISADNASNSVTVIVKPADPDDTSFGFLEDYLTQYGALGTTYSVEVATPLGFVVAVSPLSAMNATNLARAIQIIQEYCSYQNLTMTTAISGATLTQQLQMAGIYDIGVEVVVQGEALAPDGNDTQVLSALPMVNTIRQYNSAGVQIGFDADGIFRQIDNSLSILTTEGALLSQAGDFYYLSTTLADTSYTYFIQEIDNTLQAVDASALLQAPDGSSVNGKFFDFQPDDYYAFLQNTGSGYSVLRFPKSSAFSTGDTSIFNRLTTTRAVAAYPINISAISNATLIPDRVAIVGGYLICCLSRSINDKTYYQVYALTLQGGEYVPLTLSQLSSSLDSISAHFTISGNMVFIPNSDESANMGVMSQYYLYTLGGSTATISGVVSGVLPDTALVDIQFRNNILYLLTAGDNNTNTLGTYTYRFSPAYDTLQIAQQSSIAVGTEGAAPQRIGQAPTGIVLFGYPFIWLGAQPQNLLALDYSAASVYANTGNVDYETGALYGVAGQEGDYLNYTVAGTLKGGATYPYLNDVIIGE